MTGLKTSLYFHTYKVMLYLPSFGCRLYKITTIIQDILSLLEEMLVTLIGSIFPTL